MTKLVWHREGTSLVSKWDGGSALVYRSGTLHSPEYRVVLRDSLGRNTGDTYTERTQRDAKALVEDFNQAGMLPGQTKETTSC